MFDHEGPVVIGAMSDLAVGVFEHLNITSPIYMYKRLACTQRILRGAALKKYREVMVTCKQSAKELAGYKWNVRKLTGLSAEAFWTWHNTNITEYDRHTFLA